MTAERQDRPPPARSARQQARAAARGAEAAGCREALLRFLSHGPRSAKDLHDWNGHGPTMLKRALAELRAAGLVRECGRGRWELAGAPVD